MFSSDRELIKEIVSVNSVGSDAMLGVDNERFRQIGY